MSEAHRAGRFVAQLPNTPAEYRAFIPAALPPSALVFDNNLRHLENRANIAVGRLDGMTRLLPNLGRFIYMYVRKEAVLSSQIEGTQSSLSELIDYEHGDYAQPESDDVQEVSRCVAALSHGWTRLESQTLPLSMRLLREVHEKLVVGGRGADKTPGELRTSQNWIGGPSPSQAAFVPPPPHELPAALSNLEAFLHDQLGAPTPSLIKAALAHAQFETIHPFLDGNGRVGRLLITLSLISDGVLAAPVLYLSLHFKKHRNEYYQRLQRIRTHGEWEAWLAFFLQGTIDVADAAAKKIVAINELFAADRQAVSAHAQRRAAANALRLYDYARERPIMNAASVAKGIDVTIATAQSLIEKLCNAGILTETTGRARDRRYAYKRYLSLLEE